MCTNLVQNPGSAKTIDIVESSKVVNIGGGALKWTCDLRRSPPFTIIIMP